MDFNQMKMDFVVFTFPTIFCLVGGSCFAWVGNKVEANDEIVMD